MENLRLDIFVIPVIALGFVIGLYFYFLKRVPERRIYKQYILTIAILAFVFNFIWEVAQGPLYKGYEYDWQHISFCALASVADMLMVLILLFLFGLIYNNVFWTKNFTTFRVVILMLAGGVGAIIAEVWHSSRGDWAYTESMPLIPWVEVGISPVLQFTILPLIIFFAIKLA